MPPCVQTPAVSAVSLEKTAFLLALWSVTSHLKREWSGSSSCASGEGGTPACDRQLAMTGISGFAKSPATTLCFTRGLQ